MIINDDKKTKNKNYWKKTLIWIFSLTVITEATILIIFPTVEPITFKTIGIGFLAVLLIAAILVAVVQSLHEQFIDFKNASGKVKILIAITFIIATFFLILKIKQLFVK